MSKQRVQFKSTEFQPKNEYVLVKPQELQKEELSDSGFVLSINKNQSSLIRPSTGRVISVGADIDDISPEMLIIWPETDGLDLAFDDGDYMLIRYRSVIGMKKTKKKDE